MAVDTNRFSLLPFALGRVCFGVFLFHRGAAYTLSTVFSFLAHCTCTSSPAHEAHRINRWRGSWKWRPPTDTPMLEEETQPPQSSEWKILTTNHLQRQTFWCWGRRREWSRCRSVAAPENRYRAGVRGLIGSLVWRSWSAEVAYKQGKSTKKDEPSPVVERIRWCLQPLPRFSKNSSPVASSRVASVDIWHA